MARFEDYEPEFQNFLDGKTPIRHTFEVLLGDDIGNVLNRAIKKTHSYQGPVSFAWGKICVCVIPVAPSHQEPPANKANCDSAITHILDMDCDAYHKTQLPNQTLRLGRHRIYYGLSSPNNHHLR